MNLVIDNGNTRTKAFVFENDRVVMSDMDIPVDRSYLEKLLKDYPISKSIVSSVGLFPGALISFLSAHTNLIEFSHNTPVPVQNRYESPGTLGLDRLAGICGAYQLYPAQASLVIDCGTCITYDMVDEKGIYRGGAISPGIRMRFSALHTFTVKLPLLNFDQQAPELIGTDSEKSIYSGVINGTLAEVEGLIGRYKESYPALNVIICGGDTAFFDTHLKNSIFALPNLVSLGLNSIIRYNEQKH